MALSSTFAEQQRADAQRLREQAVDQGEFDFLMPYGPSRKTLAPQEVAMCIGFSVDLIYKLCDEGRLESLELPGRIYAAKRVTRRSVLLLLAEMAMGDGRERQPFIERVDRLLEVLSHDQLEHVMRRAATLKGKI